MVRSIGPTCWQPTSSARVRFDVLSMFMRADATMQPYRRLQEGKIYVCGGLNEFTRVNVVKCAMFSPQLQKWGMFASMKLGVNHPASGAVLHKIQTHVHSNGSRHTLQTTSTCFDK